MLDGIGESGEGGAVAGWLADCLPSFSFSVTAQEHTVHSLKEKGLHYFDGTQCGNGTLLQLLGIGGEEKE